MTKHLRGDELRELREARGLTGTQAAELLGIAYKTYWAWEHNQNGINPLAWETVLGKLGVQDANIHHD